MKNRDLYGLWNWISRVDTSDGKFAYALAMNKKKLKDILVVLEETPLKKEFSTYASKIRSIDSDIHTTEIDADMEREDKDKKINALVEDKVKLDVENKKLIEEHEELLDMEVDFEPYMLLKENIPADIQVKGGADLVELMEGLMPIINEG